MKIAMLSPIAWRTPPRHYGPWELVVSLITEELVSRGVDVTLFATGDSLTRGKLEFVIPRGYEEDPSADAKVNEALHISHLMESAGDYDLIHNHFDFLPLSYSSLIRTPMVTTIHGFSSARILPVYEKYNRKTHYISISFADRVGSLDYLANVYHGLDLSQFTFQPEPEDYLVFLGRFHKDKGAKEAIAIAQRAGVRLKMAGIIQDRAYFREFIEPQVDGGQIIYMGSVLPPERDILLGNALALLHPINFNEPFGLSVIEAMGTGTPVIAFPHGSMKEIILHGTTGYLVHSIEEAVDAVHSISKINRFDCRRHVEKNFTKEIMAGNYLAAYKKILGGSHESGKKI